MGNKEAIELCLEENEFFCPEVLDLFYIFSKLSNEYLTTAQNYFDEDIEIEYEEMHINETISLVREFLNNIDKKYLDIFNKSLNDGTFDMFLPEDDLVERPEEPITTPKPQSNINIPINYTIEDGAIIIHEFFHFLNETEEFSGIRDIFTEMISIYFEFRYYEFLIQKGYSSDVFYKNVYETIDNSLNCAYNLCSTSSILDIYHNTGDITLENIKLLDKNRNLYKENADSLIEYYNSEDFDEDILEFRIDVSYVVGTLLTFFALKHPKIYDIKMKHINENVNNISLKDILKILDTKIEDYNVWIKDSIKNLEKAQGEIYEQNYMYSRTYRSR